MIGYGRCTIRPRVEQDTVYTGYFLEKVRDRMKSNRCHVSLSVAFSVSFLAIRVIRWRKSECLDWVIHFKDIKLSDSALPISVGLLLH